jgi:hypothetical protein
MAVKRPKKVGFGRGGLKRGGMRTAVRIGRGRARRY